jgi:hypothetical protein
MDKAEFIELAPQYYSVAIIAYLSQHRAWAVSRQEFLDHYSINKGWSYLGRDKIFEIAVTWLLQKGVIRLVPDPFGPPIIVTSPDFDDKYDQLSRDYNYPLYKYGMTADGDSWLRDALKKLDEDYSQLDIAEADFDTPDEEWQPLPLERDDPQLQKAIAAVDDVAEKVRADNGYAANLPGEREYVLDGLSALSKRLKEASTISVAYLREFAFAPLSKVLRRFKDAAIGLAASAAKEALKDWLKRKGIAFLDWL